jgi:hypothetical protein
VKNVEIEKVESVETVLKTEKPVEIVVPVPKPEVNPVESAAPVSKPEVKPVEIVGPVSKPEESSEESSEKEKISTLTSLQSDGKTEIKAETNSVALSTPRKKKRKTVGPIRLADYVPQVPGPVLAQEPSKVDTDDI